MFKRTSLMVVLLGIALVAPAMGEGRGSNGGSWGPHPLKQPACVMACRVETHACFQDARDASAPCFTGCQPLVDAAATACKADPASDACTTAAAAARECLGPCNDVFRPAVRTCFANGGGCVQACPFIGEPPCLADCRAGYGQCLNDARTALNDCRKGCSDEYQAARAACASDPKSDACTAARAALQTCLQPCREPLKTSLDACGSTVSQCVQACGATPTPGTTP